MTLHLTDADLSALSAALQANKAITLTRTLGGARLTARTLRAAPVWGVRWVVQVGVKKGRVEWVQTFGNTLELQEALSE